MKAIIVKDTIIEVNGHDFHVTRPGPGLLRVTSLTEPSPVELKCLCVNKKVYHACPVHGNRPKVVVAAKLDSEHVAENGDDIRSLTKLMMQTAGCDMTLLTTDSRMIFEEVGRVLTAVARH